MKKIVFILICLLIIFFVLAGCIDSSTEAQSAREEIVKTQMSIENGENMQVFLTCAEEFINLSDNNAEKSVLQTKSEECDSKSKAVYKDLNSLKDLIGSYKDKVSEQFDKELESYYSDYIDLALSISMIKATIGMSVDSIEIQEKLSVCESKETYGACSSCCETTFSGNSGIQTSWFACTNVCSGKPNTTISNYCQNAQYPAQCDIWPEETCFTNVEYDAEIKNDLSYCCGISDPEDYVDCYANALVSNGRNYSECENIREKVFDGTSLGYVNNMTTRDFCYYLYASKEAFLEESLTSTREVCDNIEDEELKYLGMCFDIQGS